MAWTTNPRVMQARRRSVPVDVVVETLDGFRRHLTGRNAAVLAYYGFLTLFPLLMAATTILGFVLDGDPELQADIVDSALSRIPVIGADLEPGSTIGGNWWALVIGLGVALWGSLKAFVALQSALDDVWQVGIDDRANAAACLGGRDRRSGERRHPTPQGVGRGRRDRYRSARCGGAGGDRQRGRPATSRPGTGHARWLAAEHRRGRHDVPLPHVEVRHLGPDLAGCRLHGGAVHGAAVRRHPARHQHARRRRERVRHVRRHAGTAELAQPARPDQPAAVPS